MRGCKLRRKEKERRGGGNKVVYCILEREKVSGLTSDECGGEDTVMLRRQIINHQ